VLREALANVQQHSKASQVTVRLRSSQTLIRLEVEDDGVARPRTGPRTPASASRSSPNVCSSWTAAYVHPARGGGTWLIAEAPVRPIDRAGIPAEMGCDGGPPVLVVDDHALFRDGLISLIDDERVRGGWGGLDARGARFVSGLTPDLVLMDVRWRAWVGSKHQGITAVDSAVRIAMLTVSKPRPRTSSRPSATARTDTSQERHRRASAESLQGIMPWRDVLSSTIAAKCWPSSPTDRPALAETGADG